MVLGLQILLLLFCIYLSMFARRSVVALPAFIFGGMVLGSIINAPGLVLQ
jgi:hypothetical protein